MGGTVGLAALKEADSGVGMVGGFEAGCGPAMGGGGFEGARGSAEVSGEICLAIQVGVLVDIAVANEVLYLRAAAVRCCFALANARHPLTQRRRSLRDP